MAVMGAVYKNAIKPRLKGLEVSKLMGFLDAANTRVLNHVFGERIVSTDQSPGHAYQTRRFIAQKVRQRFADHGLMFWGLTRRLLLPKDSFRLEDLAQCVRMG